MMVRLLLLGLMLFCPLSSASAKEHFPFLGETAADKISVRAGQNVNFERVDILPQGTKVIVYEEQYGWYKIQLPSTSKAYVRVDYLTLENDQIGLVTGNRVNVRAGRGTNFSALGQLEKGQYVRIANKMDDWFQIVPLEGMRGWVSKEFVRHVSDTIPSMDSLGLVAVSASTAQEVKKEDVQSTPISSLAQVSLQGVVGPVATSEMLNNAAFQLKTAEGKIYYLQIDPAAIGKFSGDHVRVEGGLVSGVASLPFPVVAVRKFQLVL